MNASITQANPDDFAGIKALISQSARILQAPYYQQSAIETALELVGGIEELIAAGRFWLAKYGNQIIGSGGWAPDAAESWKAEIRGFFVHPNFARQGVATGLLNVCESACLHNGIEFLYLTATLSGEPFYKKRGFTESGRFRQSLSNGETFELVAMAKNLTV